MPDKTPAIYAALAAARAACPFYIQKDKRVDAPGAKYQAVTHDNVTAHTRQALIDAGVLVLPTIKLFDKIEYQTKNGGRMAQFEGVFSIAFVAVEDGSSHVIDVPAWGADTGDKAPPKALSYAVKAALLKVLNIETGEDDESRVPPPEPVLTPEEAADLEAKVAAVGDPAAFLAGMGAESFEAFPARLLPAALKQVARKEREAAESKGESPGGTA